MRLQIGIALLIDVHDVDDILGGEFEKTAEVLYLGRLDDHGDGGETEIEIEDDDEHDGGDDGVGGDGTEIGFERLLDIDTLVEVVVAKGFHLAQQFDSTAEASRVLGIFVPDALDAWCLEIGYCAHFLINYLWGYVQFEA